MLSCACDLYMLCLKSILVAYLSVEALCCLGVVVAGCWLCHLAHIQPLGCPKVLWLLPKPYWACFIFLG